MSPISVLLIGDATREEFREAREFLAAETQLTAAADVADALADLADAEIEPEVIIIAHAWPGEFLTADIDRLRQAAPLTRLVALVGSWCEGETRSGQPWPGVPRVYAHQFVPRFGAELRRATAGGSPTWTLPVTATDDERLLAAQLPESRRQGAIIAANGAIIIATRDSQMAEVLAGACRALRYEVQSTKDEIQRATGNGPRTIAAIWDGRGCDELEAQQLHGFVERMAGIPVVALLGFPRSEDRRRALAAGAAAVVSKPFLLEDLVWHLDKLSPSPSGRGPG